MKKLLSIAAAALLTLALTSCGESDSSEKKVRIGVSIPAADHGWTGGVVWYAEKAKRDLEKSDPNLEITVSTARDAAEQVSKIETLRVRKIDALVVLPQEPGPLTAICEQARKQGVYLVTVDRGLDKEVQNLNVAGDNAGFGRTSRRERPDPATQRRPAIVGCEAGNRLPRPLGAALQGRCARPGLYLRRPDAQRRRAGASRRRSAGCGIARTGRCRFSCGDQMGIHAERLQGADVSGLQCRRERTGDVQGP